MFSPNTHVYIYNYVNFTYQFKRGIRLFRESAGGGGGGGGLSIYDYESLDKFLEYRGVIVYPHFLLLKYDYILLIKNNNLQFYNKVLKP